MLLQKASPAYICAIVTRESGSENCEVHFGINHQKSSVILCLQEHFVQCLTPARLQETPQQPPSL